MKPKASLHTRTRPLGKLAQVIKDEVRRARYLAGPQVRLVLQQAQREASPLAQDHAEQRGR